MICKICGSKMAPLVEDLYICSQDGLISSHTQPDKSIYDKSYVLKYQRYERTELGEQINKSRYDTVHKHVASGRLLDFGCGVGSFLKYSNFNGIMAKGFDINPYGEYCDPTLLLDEYDIVTFWDSLEHVEDPVRLINGLKTQYLFICTPSTDDFTGKKSDIVQWRHYMPEEHVHYFNSRSLRALLSKCGYEVIEENYNEAKLRKGGGEKNIITVGGKRGTH